MIMRIRSTIIIFLISNLFYSSIIRSQANSKDVIELKCEPIENVRIGFIGLGMRGSGAIDRYTQIDHIEIVAICDVVQENIVPTVQENIIPIVQKKDEQVNNIEYNFFSNLNN